MIRGWLVSVHSGKEEILVGVVLRISPSFPVSESECNESHACARLSCGLGFNCAKVKQWWYGVTRSAQTVFFLSENCPRIIRRQERKRAMRGGYAEQICC